MKVQQALVDNDSNLVQQLDEFSEHLLSVGDGRTEELDYTSVDDTIVGTNYTKNLDNMIVPGDSLINLIQEIFTFIYQTSTTPSAAELISSTVLTLTNKEVASINQLIIDKFPGVATTYLSADSAINEEQRLTIIIEFLSSTNISSLPPHKLILKVGAPIMLLWNINATQGLCNGTRLIVKSLPPHVIEVLITTGSHTGDVVYIPKIKLQLTEDVNSPIDFQRDQCPVKLAFGMAVNKSQGQTMDRIGLYLPENVFSHGQLYVALSRVKTPTSVRIMMDKSCHSNIPPSVLNRNKYIRNVVFKEVF